MINRKVLYGYQIQNGTLEIVPEEQRTVSMVFTLYNAGASYQAISDALNRQDVPYCREVPLWNKHKVFFHGIIFCGRDINGAIQTKRQASGNVFCVSAIRLDPFPLFLMHR